MEWSFGDEISLYAMIVPEPFAVIGAFLVYQTLLNRCGFTTPVIFLIH